jgi:hypothetical protein
VWVLQSDTLNPKLVFSAIAVRHFHLTQTKAISVHGAGQVHYYFKCRLAIGFYTTPIAPWEISSSFSFAGSSALLVVKNCGYDFEN